MIALVEICDVCGTRYQGPELLPVQRSLDAAMRILHKHLPAPGERLHFACPKCAPDTYAAMTPIEAEVWHRSELRGRGEQLPELDVEQFADDPAVQAVDERTARAAAAAAVAIATMPPDQVIEESGVRIELRTVHFPDGSSSGEKKN